MPDKSIVSTLKRFIAPPRSTALYSLERVWLILVATQGVLAVFAPELLSSRFGTLLFWSSGIYAVLYFGAFIYLLVTDKDALRSEPYSLQKFAMERGIYGDMGSMDDAPDEQQIGPPDPSKNKE